MGSVDFVHTLRTGNFCADYMAHVVAAIGEDLVLRDSPTPRLQVLLLVDVGFSS